MKKKKQRYTYSAINEVFEKLMSQTCYLSKYYEDKKNTDFYENALPYVDIEILYLYIRQKVKKGELSEVDVFFRNVEEVYCNGDNEVKNFIEVGLFEGLLDFDMKNYCFAYNKWLGKRSQEVWNRMLDACLGTDWRKKKNRR